MLDAYTMQGWCRGKETPMLLTLLIVLLVLALAGGSWGYNRSGWGYRGFSPLGVLVVIFVVLLLMGAL